MKKIMAVLLMFSLFMTTVSSAMTVKDGRATLKFVNKTQQTVTGSIIAALYTDNKLQEVKTGKEISLDAGWSVSYTFNFENYETGSEVKGYFWDGINPMKPLSEKVILSSASVNNESYEGDYILAVNTDTSQSLSTGTLPQAAKTQFPDLQKNETQGPHKIHMEQEIFLPENYSDEQINFSINTISNTYEVGDKRSFVVSEFYTSKSEKYALEFVLKAVGENCYIWVACEDIDKDGAVPKKPNSNEPLTSLDIITDEMAQSLAEEYDSGVYPLLMNNFGVMNDHDGDSKLSILFYDIQDGYGPNNQSYIGGYFYSADLYPPSVSGVTGNNTDMIHIDSFPLTLLDVNEAYATMVHELQHFVNHSWLEISNVDSYSNSKWAMFNEAMSMAAEHIYCGPLEDRIWVYNNTSSAYHSYIRDGLTFLKWENKLQNYTMSYLFGQYLRTQTKEFKNGGNAIYYSIMNGLPSFDFEGLTQQYNKVIYGNNTQKYITSSKLAESFRLALILRDDYGPYGFRGEEPFDSLNLPIYTGTEATLAPGGAVLIKNDGSFTPTVSGTNMKFYGITLP